MSDAVSHKRAKNKKKQKKKDPNAPKRPRCAYILYCQALRDDMKKIHPGAKPSELMQIMGKLWKDLPNNEKKPFIDRANEDKLRFSSQMKSYVPASEEENEDDDDDDDDEDEENEVEENGPAKKKQKKKKKKRVPKKKDPNLPKRGMSAYLYFTKAMRNKVKVEHQSARSSELMQIMGKMWKELTDEQKRPFVEAAKSDKDRYQIQKAQYEQSSGIPPKPKKEKPTSTPSSGMTQQMTQQQMTPQQLAQAQYQQQFHLQQLQQQQLNAYQQQQHHQQQQHQQQQQDDDEEEEEEEGDDDDEEEEEEEEEEEDE